jgi:hypothetical protein
MQKKYFLFLIVLTTGLFSYGTLQAQASSLYVRTDKSYVQPGESYQLYVIQDKTTITGYTGYLDVKATYCRDVANCQATTIGPWGNYYVNNGTITINLASNFTPGIYKAQFKPHNSNWDWSNEIQINVGTTSGLEDAANYWIMSTDSYYFTGKNYVTGTSFTTKIGFMPPTNTCSYKTMYFLKDKCEGYWNPSFPWSTNCELNLLWHINNWQKQANWYDEYLTAAGDEKFKYHPSDPFSIESNFTTDNKTSQYRYGSKDPKIPGYVLSPRWIGSGYGIGNNKEANTPGNSNTPFCDVKTDLNAVEEMWGLHIDLVNLSLPQYNGQALRFKFYEGNIGFMQDKTKVGIREDWYFVKNIGLVKIDVKNFGPETDKRKPCLDDPDCFVNEVMASPFVSLTRIPVGAILGKVATEGGYSSSTRHNLPYYNPSVNSFENLKITCGGSSAGWIGDAFIAGENFKVGNISCQLSGIPDGYKAFRWEVSHDDGTPGSGGKCQGISTCEIQFNVTPSNNHLWFYLLPTNCTGTNIFTDANSIVEVGKTYSLQGEGKFTSPNGASVRYVDLFSCQPQNTTKNCEYLGGAVYANNQWTLSWTVSGNMTGPATIWSFLLNDSYLPRCLQAAEKDITINQTIETQTSVPKIIVTSPTENQQLVNTQTYKIQWTATQGIDKVAIALYQNGGLIGIIGRDIPAQTSSVNWIPSVSRGDNYRIAVYQYPWTTGGVVGYSSGTFSIK